MHRSWPAHHREPSGLVRCPGGGPGTGGDVPSGGDTSLCRVGRGGPCGASGVDRRIARTSVLAS
ncbi:hypothetical protein ATKI12_1439 [Kitasatospora sp. Ki12]